MFGQLHVVITEWLKASKTNEISMLPERVCYNTFLCVYICIHQNGMYELAFTEGPD